jgi:DNA-binding CsgD family transcriptional regulator
VSPGWLAWQNGPVAHRSLTETVLELRGCLPARRRPTRSGDPVAPLARLIAASRSVEIAERPGGLVIKLQAEGDPSLRLTCVLHHALPAPLTAAEAAVAELLCESRTLAQIAVLRGVSVNTIKSQVRQVFRKLEVDSRVALVRRLAP